MKWPSGKKSERKRKQALERRKSGPLKRPCEKKSDERRGPLPGEGSGSTICPFKFDHVVTNIDSKESVNPIAVAACVRGPIRSFRIACRDLTRKAPRTIVAASRVVTGRWTGLPNKKCDRKCPQIAFIGDFGHFFDVRDLVMVLCFLGCPTICDYKNRAT